MKFFETRKQSLNTNIEKTEWLGKNTTNERSK